MGQKKSEYDHFSRSVSAGSEPVTMRLPLWDIHTKSRVLATISKFRVIISINLITTLESAGCYMLLPAFKVEMPVKKQLFWQAGDDVRMRVTPTWCGWVGITVVGISNQLFIKVLIVNYNFQKNKVVIGKTPFFKTGPFFTLHSICLNIGFWQDNFVWKCCVFNFSIFN